MTQAVLDTLDRQRFQVATGFAQPDAAKDNFTDLKVLPDEVI